MTKVCSRCHIEKSVSEFWKAKNSAGLGSYCKECCKEKLTEYRRRQGIPPLKRKEVYVLPDYKICSCCKCEKSNTGFRVRWEKREKQAFPYLNSTCKECDTALAAERYSKKRNDAEYKKKHARWAKERYWRKRDELIERSKIWRNKASAKENRKKYIQKNKQKIFEQEKISKNKYQAKHRDNITDEYCIRQLVSQGFGTREQIERNTKIIETERVKIIAWRVKKYAIELQKQNNLYGNNKQYKHQNSFRLTAGLDQCL